MIECYKRLSLAFGNGWSELRSRDYDDETSNRFRGCTCDEIISNFTENIAKENAMLVQKDYDKKVINDFKPLFKK